MPKTPITAKFVRIPVEGARLPIAPKLDDFLDPKKMCVLELGMQKGNLDAACGYFPEEQSKKLIDDVNAFNEKCRSAGIPVIHIGSSWREDGLDLRTAQSPRILALNGKKFFPNPDMVQGSELCAFATDFVEGDYKLLGAKRYNAFEGTDLEFLLKVLDRKIILLVGAGYDCIGMGTGFCGMCKDFKTLVVEDLFPSYCEELDEECKKASTMFIGLVVHSNELTAEIEAAKA